MSTLPSCESCGMLTGVTYRVYPSGALVCCFCRDTDRVITVPTTSGRYTTYTVTLTALGTPSAHGTCTCKGYKFHNKCKHVAAALISPPSPAAY